jgi:tetratricopeptide (TPR) repeat protein
MIRHVFWALLALLALPSRGLPAIEDPDGLVQRRWFEARTAHFHIYSCGATQEVARLAARLEQFREAYSLLAGTQAVASPPIVVMAYPNIESLKPFLPLYQGQPASLTAFFNRGSDENLIVLPLGNAYSLELIFHEYTHLLLRHNDHIWPLWLKEGMAEIYATFEVTGSQSARIGKPIPRHVQLIAHKPLLPLSQLFAVSHDSAEYNEQEHQGIFYAESWLLTHYLMLGDNAVLKSRFGQLTTLLRQGQAPEQAFTNAFKVPAIVIERELRRYHERGKFPPYQFLFATDLTAPRVLSTRPLTSAEVCFRLGDQLLRVGRSESAAAFFEQSCKSDPKSPLGYEGLGLLAAEQKRSADAIHYFQESFQRGSSNFLAYFLSAREKYRRTSQAPDTFYTLSKEAAAEIRSGLQKSLSLTPDFGAAHHLLGFLEMVQGEDFGSAEQHLQRAIQLEPENQSYLLSLAQAELIHKGPEAARKTLAPLLLPNAEPKLRSHAEQMLQEMSRQPESRRK